MKILLLSPVSLPYHSGTSSIVANTAIQLAAAGHAVTVAAPGAEPVAQYSIPGITVARLPVRIRVGNAAVLSDIGPLVSRYDIVDLYYPFFGVAELLALGWWRPRRLFVTYVMDYVPSNALMSLLALPSRLSFPWLAARSERIITASLDYTRQSEHRDVFLRNAAKVAEVPYGSDPAMVRSIAEADDPASSWGGDDGRPVLLFVGALDRAHYFKGLEVLIDACTYLQSVCRLLIVGDGAMRGHYQRRVADAGLDRMVTFLGYIDDDELNMLYNRCAVVVQPSTTSGEAFGVSLLNAMACAKPVIASDLPGVRQAVAGAGLLVPAGDSQALADAIDRVVNDPELSRSMAAHGYDRWREMYNWETAGRALARLFEPGAQV